MFDLTRKQNGLSGSQNSHRQLWTLNGVLTWKLLAGTKNHENILTKLVKQPFESSHIDSNFHERFWQVIYPKHM